MQSARMCRTLNRLIAATLSARSFIINVTKIGARRQDVRNSYLCIFEELELATLLTDYIHLRAPFDHLS